MVLKYTWKNGTMKKKIQMLFEMIFNKIILEKFGKEYNKLITYQSNMKYQRLLFNSNDLMSYIFEYFELYHGKVYDDSYLCSLVNSHWLYHVWNVNSVYFVDLNVLIEKTLGYKESDYQYRGIKLDRYVYVIIIICTYINPFLLLLLYFYVLSWSRLSDLTGDSEDDDSDSSSSISSRETTSDINIDIDSSSIKKDKNDQLVVEKTEKLRKEMENKSNELQLNQEGSVNQMVQNDKNDAKKNENNEKEAEKKVVNIQSKKRLIMGTWQRFINAKSIYINWSNEYEKEEYNNDKILNRLLLLKNIESINVYFAQYDSYTCTRSLSALKIILFKSRKTIKLCKIRTDWLLTSDENKENELLPSTFPNSQCMEICDSYFYRIWSFKCQELILNHLKVTQNWCNFVINNCDCTNIHTLAIYEYIKVDESINLLI